MKSLTVWLIMLLCCLIGGTGCAGKKEAKVVGTAKEKSIRLLWQHRDTPETDLSLQEKVPGITVVSPVWYTMTNEYGKLEDRSVPGYVERAHQKGYKVWPLVNNGFDVERTHRMLQDHHAQRFLIDQLLEQASLHHFDGINVDFENIYDDDRDALTSFVAYLRRLTREKGLILSIDVTVPGNSPNWSRCFDRKALAKETDYIILMTYDQYSRHSNTPGPTASFNWDEDRVRATLKEGVPAAKLVFGVPLYMRLWSRNLQDGSFHVRTLDMKEAEKLNREKASLPSWRRQWLPDEKMMRCSFEENGISYVFWQEDALSLFHKTRLIKKYHLAGMAAWRYGFETPDVWKLIH
jgi:spore germination protein YaaH